MALTQVLFLLSGPRYGEPLYDIFACRDRLESLYPVLKRFHKDKGRWPHDMSELYPAYVDKRSLLLCPSRHACPYRISRSATAFTAPTTHGDVIMPKGAILVTCKDCHYARILYEQPILLRRLALYEQIAPTLVLPEGRVFVDVADSPSFKQVAPLWVSDRDLSERTRVPVH